MKKKTPELFFVIFFLFCCFLAGYSFTENAKHYKACVIPVKGMVDKGLSGFIIRSINEASESGCQYAIFEIDTFGGRVDAAVEIRDAILDAPFEKTIAYINKRAISAGALIALSNKSIFMADGGTIGAAQPVQMGGTGEAQSVGEKYVSYLRKEFKSTAEKNGYPPEIAEAFVDSDVEIEGLIEKGKLLTLTSQEARKHKVASDILPDRNAIFEMLYVKPEEVVFYSMNWSEVLVRILTHPVVSSLLLTFGFLGMIFELRMPGFGASGIIGLTCLILFFLGHYLIGLAQWADVLVFMIGVVLIALEVFVIPGFGIAGISGMACMLLGIFLALIKREMPSLPIPSYQYEHALTIIGLAVILTAAGSWAAFKYILPEVPAYNKIFLRSSLGRISLEKVLPDIQDERKSLVGKTGITHTKLRPAGKAIIEGKLYDVVTAGEFIEQQKEIVVTEATSTKIVVEEKMGENHA